MIYQEKTLNTVRPHFLLLMIYQVKHSQAPIGPKANYNSRTGQPDTTGAGDLDPQLG
jgi:hypothetical protein